MAFYNQQPYHNPIIPFTGCIQGALQKGKSITITGRALPGAERFHVNLQCGPSKQADVAFHFNPRYDSLPGYVVCNTYQHSTWGGEERKYEAPIPRGSYFTLNLLVNRDSYSVVVNGLHFMEFRHRLSITRVDTICVDGGVEVNSISFQNPVSVFPLKSGNHVRGNKGRSHRNKAFAQFAAPGFVMAPPPYTPGPSYAMPYKAFITGGMHPGRSVTVQGMVNPSAVRFDFNLRFNLGIAFHFNPRFDESTVVRNSFLREKWGPEERGGGMPFYRGQPFTVTIACDSQQFKVLVNGAQMFTYKHRYSALQEIDILEVNGDMTLTSVVI